MDSWWIGAELRGSLSRFSFGLKALTNVSSEAGGWMKDSDWDDEANPSRRTIYSESRNRMDPSYYIETDIDMKISDWVPLPSRLDLRPLIGYRWQQLNMVTHDGTQWEIGNAPVPLPGNGIRFQQIYNHFFWGFRANLDLGKWGWISRLSTFMQLDWAYVEGSNRDHHLLRAGSRFTYDETSGQAWHEVIGLKAALSKHLALTLKADFIQIDTSGTHRLVNAPLGVDFKMSHGIRVWSEQNSFSLTLDYTF
jgi:outer membrane protease